MCIRPILTSSKAPYLVACLLGMTACQSKAPPPPRTVPSGLVAQVNGVPLTELDLRSENRGHAGMNIATPDRKALLEGLIRTELQAQEALALGLDQDPVFQERMSRMEAQYRAIRRKELADIYFRRQVSDAISVSDAEAQAYFAKHTSRLQTEWHLYQLLFRQADKAEQTLGELRKGRPFEAVAAAQFPVLPSGATTPWDLGFLKWKQMPAPWREVALNLKPGETSGVIRGENQRYWIIKLVERRQQPALTFEAVKDAIVDELKSEKIAGEQERAWKKLHAKASVVLEASQPKP